MIEKGRMVSVGCSGWIGALGVRRNAPLPEQHPPTLTAIANYECGAIVLPVCDPNGSQVLAASHPILGNTRPRM